MAVEMLTSALVSLLVEKVADPILQQVGAMWDNGDKLNKLRRALLDIRSKLGDAEERQIREPAVRDWLAALRRAAYDAEDILDEFNIEVLQRKAEIQKDTTNKVRDFFSFRFSSLFPFGMRRKLKDIAERIDDLYKESSQFNFLGSMQPQTQERPQTHSYVVESEVIGREHEKEAVVKSLLDQAEKKNVTVLPIIGMGGLGKTTFAQLVYNDERVQKHFQLRMWVCVSDDFDVVKLAKEIIVSATGFERDLPTRMDLLQRRLREEVSRKRYLLVLDDVWNEDQDKWEGLRSLMNCDKEGSVIMVTTRSEKVSSITGTRPTFRLSYLAEEDSWDLFKKRAFAEGAEPPPELERIGKEIVKRCGGLPLAIKTLGSLMRTKSEEREWLAVKRSEIWDMQDGEEKILAPLKLSYNDMPSYVRQCFALCAIFPKDYEMEKEMLIQLWSAHEFIPSEEEGELEVKGQEIYKELVWRSFLQDVRQIDDLFLTGRWRRKATCKMHDLMHDLAQSIVNNECIVMLEPAHLDKLSENVRHLSIHCTSPFDAQRVLNKCPTIRTLLLPETKYKIMKQTGDISKPVSLRAFELHAMDSMTFLKSTARLIHLRYLDLSETRIKTLPQSISTLYNLQTLKLSYCRQLRMLPEDMRHMSSLRHLYLDGCDSLKRMPAGIGQLTSLQTLTKYIAGQEAGTTITELKCLNLCGPLELHNLKNVRNPEDAKEANMRSKENLYSLAFCWGVAELDAHDAYTEDDELQAENSEEVLEALKPHSGLKGLALWSYHGVRFPTWMMDYPQLPNLVEIHLGGCIRCEKLPPLWRLPSLEVLCLRKLEAIKHICSNINDGATSTGPFQAFPSLKRLVLEKMQNLEAWWEGEGRGEGEPLFFPQLVDLSIIGCPELTSLPRLPPLRSLKISGSDRVPLEQISCLTTLSTLSIGRHEARPSRRIQLPLLPQEVISFKQLKSIEKLFIKGCEEFALLLEDEDEALALSTSLRHLSLTECNWMFSPQLTPAPFGLWKHLTSLRYLFIYDSEILEYWPDKELRALSSLTFLSVLRCKNFTGKSQPLLSTGEGIAPPLEDLQIIDCDALVELPKCPASLKYLVISCCQNLESLTEELEHLTALTHLEVYACSKLTSMSFQLVCLPSLEYLYISDCSDLTSLPEGMQGLTSLRQLTVEGCPRLTLLPEGLRQQLPSIETLEIEGCPEVERRCKRGGEYWDVIAQVPARKIGSEQEE